VSWACFSWENKTGTSITETASIINKLRMRTSN
jgi:hypothetical protein